MAIGDYIRGSNGSGEAVMAVVTTDRGIASATLITDSVLNWPAKGIATSGDLDTNTGLIDPDTATVFKYHLDGSIIMIDSYAPGYSDVGNTVGQAVVLKPATEWADEVADQLDGLDTAKLDKDLSVLTAKTTPVDADLMVLADSAATNTPKKLTFANLWAWVLTKIQAITSLSGFGFFLDEDDMASDSATKVPSQQSVKAYGVDIPEVRLKSYNRCKVGRSTDFAIGPSAWTAIPMTAEFYDLNNMHDNSTNNTRITIQVSGYYHFGAVVRVAGSGIGGIKISRFNSAGVLQTGGVMNFQNSIKDIDNISGEHYLNAGDYLVCHVFNGIATNVTGVNGGEPESSLQFWCAMESI